MKPIEFYKENTALILKYTPDDRFDTNWVRKALDEDGSVTIKSCFTFYPQNEYILNEESEFIKSYAFQVGVLKGEYYKLDNEIFGTENCFFFQKDIAIKYEYFLAPNKFAILNCIDKLVKCDVYIGDNNSTLPYDVFVDLIRQFPNSYEIKRYSDKRISQVLKNYFDGLGDYESKYEKYLNNKLTSKSPTLLKEVRLVQQLILVDALDRMKKMLDQ